MIRSIIILLFLLICSQVSADTLRVGYADQKPYIFNTEKGIDGPLIYLWESVAKDLGTSYEVKKYTDADLKKKLASNEIDICLFPFTLNSENAENYALTTPFYTGHSKFLTKTSSGVERLITFFKSFLSLEYLAVIITIVFAVFVFGFLGWLAERRKNSDQFDSGAKKGLWDGFWWSAVTMMTVGYGDKSPKTVAGKLVALVWMFMAIVIIYTFTATVTSRLTVSELDTKFQKLEEFKNQKIGILEGSNTHTWLKNNYFNTLVPLSNEKELLEALKNDLVDVIGLNNGELSLIKKELDLKNYEVLSFTFNPQNFAIGCSSSMDTQILRDLSQSILKHTESMEWQVVLNEFKLRSEN